MVDVAIHTFKTNTKSLVWLVFTSLALAALIIVLSGIIYLKETPIGGIEDLAYIVMIILITIVGGFMLFCDWQSYLFARQTTLQVDMQTFTITYTHNGHTKQFKGSEVAHWYWDTGMYMSRVSVHQSVLVLKSGEELFVPMWLFEGNKFLMSNEPAYNTFNGGYFLNSVKDLLLLPEPEDAPRYRYLLPKTNGGCSLA